jgi:2,4-diketo-3-deoxy-L-fuconate hydrolase
MGFRLGNVEGRAVLVEGDGVFDLERASDGRLGAGARAAIAGHAVLHEVAAGLVGQQPDRTLADVTLGPPQPDPWQVFAIGLNYRGHAAETGKALPEAPLVFTKFPGCLTGPVATVEMASDTTDYEAELVVVIGDTVRNVSAADAWNVVAGLMIGQDLSDRELQNAGERPQFSLAKSHDGYGPTGPLIVSPDLLDDPDALEVRCFVNGEQRQADTTHNLIFSVPVLVEYLSRMMTLHAGDLIFTGTPEGVGLATGNYLRSGDVVRTTITGLGELTTTLR